MMLDKAQIGSLTIPTSCHKREVDTTTQRCIPMIDGPASMHSAAAAAGVAHVAQSCTELQRWWDGTALLLLLYIAVQADWHCEWLGTMMLAGSA